MLSALLIFFWTELEGMKRESNNVSPLEGTSSIVILTQVQKLGSVQRAVILVVSTLIMKIYTMISSLRL